ncbi:hypothetical protein MJ581_04115 [Escherichia coli]|nr:hypothetical protein MJ581_04115 [Escherichia coli]
MMVRGGPHAKLKLDHLGKEVLESRLPGILELFPYLLTLTGKSRFRLSQPVTT